MADDTNENNRETKPMAKPINDSKQWWLKFVPDPKLWSDVNISRFLSIYKAHSILWDPTHSFYKDLSRRMKAYTIIAQKLNLYGIRETECIKLVESLRDLYAKEKTRQTIASRCRSQKYTPPPRWYHMLKELVETVQQKLANPVRKGSTSSVKTYPSNPWEICCARLYTEDIWTPEHFKTNVMESLLKLQDEQLLCTCHKFPVTNFDDICSMATSSTYHRDSTSDSSSKINQCLIETSSNSSKTCCFNTQNSKSPEWCKVTENCDDEMEVYNHAKPKKRAKISSLCEGNTVNDTTICGDEKTREKIEAGSKNTARCQSENAKHDIGSIESYCSEAVLSKPKGFHDEELSVEETCCDRNDYNHNTPKTNEKCRTKKRQKNREKTIVRCKNSETICEQEDDISYVSCSEAVKNPVHGSYKCRENKSSLPEDTSMTQEPCGVDNEIESVGCRREAKYKEQSQCNSKITSRRSRPNKPCRGPKKELLESCGELKGIACRSEGSAVSSRSENSSEMKFQETCCCDNDKKPAVMASKSPISNDSSSLLECRLASEKEYSDHRLDYHPDPTLCEKCAADRNPVREARKNLMHFQDPRIPELDKYCRYKDWDAIYNIKTQVLDEEPIFQIKKDSLLIMGCEGEQLIPRRQNHSPTEADVNLFTDPISSEEGKQISLNNEYKWEYGLNIEIDQPRHNYACDVLDISQGYEPVQLIL